MVDRIRRGVMLPPMDAEDDDAVPRAVPERGLPIGTPVLTPSGEVAVERLAPGDLVIAVSGQAAPFQRVVEIRRLSLPAALVRLRAGAIAEGTPREDLRLPPGHGLLLDGTLVEAGALLGGPGTLFEQAGGMQDVLGIVLGTHDAVLAAGMPVETVPPAFADQPPFAPRAGADAALRALLAWRAEVMGWAEALPATPDIALPDPEEDLVSSALGPALPVSPIR